MKIILPLAIASLGMSVPASAVIVSGDVLVFDIGLSASETGGNWNNLSAASGGQSANAVTNAIRFSDGASTGVGLALANQTLSKVGIGGINTVTDPGSFSSPGFIASGAIPETAYQDLGYFSNEDSTNTFTFSNLDDSLSYTLSFISRTPAGTDRATFTWNIAGQDSVTIDPEDNANIYSFSGLNTDGTGKIVVSIPVTGTLSTDAAFVNAIELVAIPEPGTYALMVGFSVLGLAILSRRSS